MKMKSEFSFTYRYKSPILTDTPFLRGNGAVPPFKGGAEERDGGLISLLRMRRLNTQVIALLMAILTLGLLPSCNKEKNIIYDVNDVNVNRPEGNKDYVKSLAEFISIAFTDLFGQNISQAELQTLAVPYSGFGDLKLIEDMIIKNFLNSPSVIIPSDSEMRENVDQFLMNTYQKLFNRLPNEFELWHMKSLINENSDITPELIYYAIMTSNEYRYY
jgi:hypothetical protein